MWHKDGYDVVRCPSCGLVFRAELPDEHDLLAIYDDEYFRDHADRADRHGYSDYLRDEPLHRANARRRVRLLAAHLPAAGGPLLDVGCAAGFFVDEARRAGWDASGVDVSPGMVEWARRELEVPVVRGTFVEAEIANAPLDAVTMWDYIEHSLDPRRDLEKARALLRPGGIVAISTGDVGSVAARLSGRRWHLLTPEHHNFFFDRATLGRLLAKTGFTILDRRHRGSLYSSAHVLYKLSALGWLRPLRGTVERLGRTTLGTIAVPLNLYDIVTVIARRA